MRQVYPAQTGDQHLDHISFYSPSSGYLVFSEHIGFTTDSGRSYIQRPITNSNVDLSGSSLSFITGFVPTQVHAFDQQNLIVGGSWVWDPVILRSTDGGATFKVVFHRKQDLTYNELGIKTIRFLADGQTGYAIDEKYLLKTTNGGQSWAVLRDLLPAEAINRIIPINENDLFLYSTGYEGPPQTNRLFKSNNGGASWQLVTLPAGNITSAFFLTAAKGWVNIEGGIFYTADGGATWTRQNSSVVPFVSTKLIFTNETTGYAIGNRMTVHKTTDGGKFWEPLPRQSDYSNDFGFRDIFAYSATQLWAGGGYRYLELTTNAGGIPIPQATFTKDTTGYSTTGAVQLTNYSKTSHSFKWFKNDTLISTSYNASYTRTSYPLRDTIMLIVSNGTRSDTAIQYQEFYEPAYITSFSPVAARSGATVTINGYRLGSTTAVYFGGVPATSFIVEDANTIKAVVGNGNSGSVSAVVTYRGTASLPGFTFYPSPSITSFSPLAATAGSSLTITGTNFQDITAIRVAGIPVTNYTIVSPTTLTLVVPSGRSGGIEITTRGGVAQLAGFTAIPSINAFAPAIGTEGTILRIRGASLQEVTGVTIGGLPAVSFNIVSADSMTAIVGLGASGSVQVSTAGHSASRPGFSFVQPPSITAIAPLSGAIGTTVIITGTNFHSVAANNIVLFGSLRANVTAASATSLTVTVPAGVTTQFISVTSNGLTAFSSKPFHTTFTGGAAITPASFNKLNFTTEGPGEYREYVSNAVGDIDGDGKEDILISDGMAGESDVLGNTSNGNDISFTPHVRVSDLAESSLLSDLDGDGKPELIEVGQEALQVYYNTSVPGSFTFSDYNSRISIWLPASRPFHNIAVKDIDKDGKADIIVATLQDIYIFRNNGDPGYLAFKPVTLTNGGYDLAVDDVDQDGKFDIIQFNPATNSISIYKNISTKGQVKFTAATTLAATTPYMVTTGDVDGDGLPDIVAGSQDGNKLEVFKNVTSAGNTAFANSQSYPMPGIAYDAVLTDLNGDGKLDIAAATDKYHFVSFTNTSTPGIINFDNSVNHHPGTFNIIHTYRPRISVADLNGDGRPDPLLIDKNVNARLCVYRNEAIAKPYIREFTPTMAGQGAVVTIKGKHFTGTTAVAFGGVAAAFFTILSDTAIAATLGTGTSGNVAVTNAYGTTQVDGFVFGAIPRILSFSPGKGPVGTKVTLTGSGFDPVPDNNTVFFGGVKTAVLTASPTALTLLVPAGTSPDWITVTTNGRTAWSSKHFIVTFPGKTTGFSDSSFVANGDLAPGVVGAIADLDKDGKNDLVCFTNSLHSTKGLLIARNTSTRGNVSLETAIPLTMDKPAIAVTVADFDGDGRIDIAAVAGLSSPYEPTLNSYLIFRNTTSGNAISFAPPVTYKIAEFTFPGNNIAAGDLDGDGRPEVIASITNNGIFTVRKNLSYPGQIAFGEAQQYWTNPATNALTCDDIDGDGKAEVMISHESSYYAGSVVIFKNTAPEGITLELVPGIPVGGKPSSVSFGDIDGDGKTDVLSAAEIGKTISVARNVSTTNKPGYNTTYIPIEEALFQAYSSGLADLDGDGKPEMVIAALTDNSKSTIIYKNASAPGMITWEPRVFIEPSTSNSFFVDMDGDGVVDILAGLTYLNKMAIEPVVELCQDSDTLLVAGFTSPAYQWQQDAGNGFENIQDNVHFQGSAGSALQLTNVPASWNGRKYRCIDQAQLPGRAYQLNIRQPGSVPVVQITTDKDSICTGSEISFTAKVENGGNAPSYQWQVNGNNIGQYAATFGSRELKDGDEVKVLMTSSARCVSTPIAVSNIIRVNVKEVLHTAVTIKATPDTGCTSDFITFTAYPVNGGLQPFFTWIMNDQAFGNDGTTIRVSAANAGHRIKARMTTSLACASEYRVLSTNELTIGGEGPGDPPVVLTPTVSIKASATEVCLGDEITFTATPKYGGNAPGYQWQVNGLPAGQNNPVFTANNLKPGDVIRVVMTSSAPCAISPMATSNAITLTSGPLVTPSVTITTQDNGACAGAEVTFTATPSHGGTAPAYQWKINGIAVGTNSNVFKTTTLNNGDKVTVTLSSNASCVTRDTAVSDTLTMAITPMVTPEITITASATEVCAGTRVYFTATTVHGGTIPQILWLNGTRGPAYSTTSLADGHTISAILVSNLNCKTALYAESNVITMKVKPSFKPDVSLAASASEICSGAPVTFTATPVHGGPSPVYEWLVNDAPVAGVTTGIYTATNLKNGDKVQVYMQSTAECVDYTNAYSNAITMNVASTSTASVTIDASATSVCAGTNITFTATPTNGGATPTYQWQVNGVNVGQNAPTFNSSTLANNDQVKAILTSNAYCVNNATSTSNTIPVIVNPSVIPMVVISGNATVDENNSALMIASAVFGGTAPIYQWQDSTATHGWQDIAGAMLITINYTPAQTGDQLRCRLTSNAPCAAITTAFSLPVSFTINNTTGGRVAPNPVQSTLHIDQLKLSDQWQTAEIANVSGGSKFIVRSVANLTSVDIPVGHLAKGLYVVILRNNKGETRQIKFLKQ